MAGGNRHRLRPAADEAELVLLLVEGIVKEAEAVRGVVAAVRGVLARRGAAVLLLNSLPPVDPTAARTQ